MLFRTLSSTIDMPSRIVHMSGQELIDNPGIDIEKVKSIIGDIIPNWVYEITEDRSSGLGIGYGIMDGDDEIDITNFYSW